MKLYKKVEWRDANNLAFYKEPEEATLDDLRQAAKEFGCVVVPMEPTEAMLDASWRQAGESAEMRSRYHYRIAQHYKLMIGAAEAADE